MSDLEELKRLAREATPGGWHVGRVYKKCSRDHGARWHGGPDCVYEEFGRDTVYDAEGTSLYADSGEGVVSGCPDGASISEPNARYMAAANPTAVLALIERVEMLELDNSQLKRDNQYLERDQEAMQAARDALRERVASLMQRVERAEAQIDAASLSLNRQPGETLEQAAERAMDEVAGLLERAVELERFASGFAETVDHDLRAIEQRGKGGMQVTPTGDFASAPTSVQVRLAWWSERAKEALKEGK